MIVKRFYNPFIVFTYIWEDVALSLAASVTVYLLARYGYLEVALPTVALTVVATALSIFLGLKGNAAYARWWEARSQWSAIATAVRILARLVVTFADAKKALPTYQRERSEAFNRRMVYRLVAWVLIVRNTLRFGPAAALDDAQPFLLDSDDVAAVQTKKNPANYVLQLFGRDIYRAMGDGTLVGFDSMQMEGQLAALTAAYSACERIKLTPIPRSHSLFTRVFVIVFIVVLPFCTIGSYVPFGNEYLVIPLSTIIASAFALADKSSTVIEHPFANLPNDVPMSALALDLERDVRELLDEPVDQLPPVGVPVFGYLY